MLRALRLAATCMMVSVASAAQAQQRVAFYSELPEPMVGLTPTAVATADFNGDKKIDIAVANYDSSDVSILLGNDDGTFLDSGATLQVGLSPVSIAVGDFNNDHKPDIITANEAGDPDNPGGSVAVLLNQGGGAFAQAVFTATGNSPESVVVGDFDGDPYPDVATADNFDNTVTVLKGVGDGTFSLVQAYSVGEEPIGLAVGLLDNDAVQDLVVTNSYGGPGASGTLTVLKGVGDGTFVPQQPEISLDCGQAGGACSPYAVAAAKLDSDSNLDLAVVNNLGDSVSILLGNGDLTFHAASPAFAEVGSFPVAIAVEDFNGDGKTDIATSSSFEDNVSVLIGRGDGTFMPAVDFGVGVSPAGIATGRFNNDEKPDLVCTNQEDRTVSILINTTGCVGDCNGDGQVTVDDLLTLASIALGNAPLAQCLVADINQDTRITVDEIVASADSAIAGCTNGTGTK